MALAGEKMSTATFFRLPGHWHGNSSAASAIPITTL
jgi:hypothetical protein